MTADYSRRYIHWGVVISSFLFLCLFPVEKLKAQEERSYSFPKIQLGKASYYCPSFHGNRTAAGTFYNEKDLVAAHPYYPFGTLVRVTNLGNGRNVEVTVTDRGPSKKHQKRGGVIDVSRDAARELGMLRHGRVRVRVEVLEWGGPKSFFTP
ncbi:MAG: septal ring lytic transglycosylase RlpA family protein [Desulfobacterota bacterium]|jgi:rare lipoprotein A|nr:septal ring lytic transglycosylase RlpA family protein [Thermodesulfobacteriota bacterium]